MLGPSLEQVGWPAGGIPAYLVGLASLIARGAFQHVNPHQRLPFLVIRNHVVRAIEFAASIVPRN